MSLNSENPTCQNSLLILYRVVLEMLENVISPAIEEAITKLNQLLLKARKNRRNCLIAKTTGTSVAATGTVLSVAAVFMAPLTLGLSLPILGSAGVTMGVLGSATSFGTSCVDNFAIEKKDFKEVRLLLEKIISLRKIYELAMTNLENFLLSTKEDTVLCDLTCRQSTSYAHGVKAGYFKDHKVHVCDLKDGDHIFRKIKGCFGISASGNQVGFHHGVVLLLSNNGSATGTSRELKVVDFGKRGGGAYSVDIVSLHEFLEGKTTVRRRDYRGMDIPVEKTNKLANEILQQKQPWGDYNLFKNNCEHFASFLKLPTGAWSAQVQKANVFVETALSGTSYVSHVFKANTVLLALKTASRPITIAPGQILGSAYTAGANILTRQTSACEGIANALVNAGVPVRLPQSVVPNAARGFLKAAAVLGPVFTVVDISFLIQDFRKKQINITVIEDAIKQMQAQKAEYVRVVQILKPLADELIAEQ